MSQFHNKQFKLKEQDYPMVNNMVQDKFLLNKSIKASNLVCKVNLKVTEALVVHRLTILMDRSHSTKQHKFIKALLMVFSKFLEYQVPTPHKEKCIWLNNKLDLNMGYPNILPIIQPNRLEELLYKNSIIQFNSIIKIKFSIRLNMQGYNQSCQEKSSILYRDSMTII